MQTPFKSEALVQAEREGIDLSLRRERLKLTPTERLERHQTALDLVDALRASRDE